MNTVESNLTKGLHAIIKINTKLNFKDEYRMLRNLFDNVCPLSFKQETFYLVDLKDRYQITKYVNCLCFEKIEYIESKDHRHVELFNQKMERLGELTSVKKHWGYCYRNLRTGEYYKLIRGI